MLSLSVIKSSRAAVSYYEKDDYYCGNSEDPDTQGQWYSRGASELGLVGSVDRDVFKAMLDGSLPDGTVLGRWRGTSREHTPGWDLTFSAPKSVSIAAEVAGDERLFGAHDRAVKASLDWIEQRLATYRTPGFLGTVEKQSGNLVSALFQHETSRENDPQLHTHAVVLNATEREDGRWVSLHSKPLFEFKMASGNVYRAALAVEVQKLGYPIRLVGHDGRFELAEVPEALLEIFSQRRSQIEVAMLERDLHGARAAAQSALMTRSAKASVDRNVLRSTWTQRAAAHSQELEKAVAGSLGAGDVRDTTPANLGAAVDRAVDRLSEPEAVFSHADLIRWSLAESMGKTLIYGIESAIRDQRTQSSLKPTRLHNRDAWTTPRAKEQECRVLATVARGRDTVSPAAKRTAIHPRLAASSLNEGQRLAVELIATTSDRFVGILGRPGTGKTYMLSVARSLLEEAGFRLTGMAQNSEAARRISMESGIPSSTVHRHLTNLRGDLSRMTGASARASKSIRAAYQNQVWVVDEAGQMDMGLMRRLSFAAERLGARLVMIGDPSQLPAISAGKPFDLLLKDGLRHVELDEIRRQTNPEYIRAIRDTIAGNIPEALARLRPDIYEEPAIESRLAALLQTWQKLGDGRSDALILTAAAREKDLLNEGARDILRREGRLSSETAQIRLERVFGQRIDRTHADFYKPDDWVRFPRTIGKLGIESGTYLRVIAVDAERNFVTLATEGNDEATAKISWNPAAIGGSAKRGVEVFRPRETTLAPGEVIRWNRNSGERGLSNGQLLSVSSVGEHEVSVRTQSGTSLVIDTGPPQGQHWDHAYASTVYSSQGSTARVVLVNAESGKGKLFSQKSFLVAISRQRDELKIYTDDVDQLSRDLAHELGEKTSVKESYAESIWRSVQMSLERLENQFPESAMAQRPQLGRELSEPGRDR